MMSMQINLPIFSSSLSMLIWWNLVATTNTKNTWGWRMSLVRKLSKQSASWSQSVTKISIITPVGTMNVREEFQGNASHISVWIKVTTDRPIDTITLCSTTSVTIWSCVRASYAALLNIMKQWNRHVKDGVTGRTRDYPCYDHSFKFTGLQETSWHKESWLVNTHIAECKWLDHESLLWIHFSTYHILLWFNIFLQFCQEHISFIAEHLPVKELAVKT